MLYGFDLFLSPGCGVFLERVHPYIYVRAVRVLVPKPCLKLGACGFLCARDALDGFAEIPVEHKHGNAVVRIEVVEDVFRGRRDKRCRFFYGIHTSSLWKSKMKP